MKKHLQAFMLQAFCCSLLCLPGLHAMGQTTKKTQSVPAKKELNALRVTSTPKIDGVLDEPEWQQAQIATDFIQNRPNPGPKERYPTQVKILYDDAALYIGAVVQDASRDSIFDNLSGRDDTGNSDFFGVFLDTYNDEINGYGFFVTPAGVQLDARYSSIGEDFSWNAVWESNATIEGNTWFVEVKIPYSAIRFSERPEQLWGLNFMRNRQSTRQGYFWSHVDPAKDGFVNQWGLLKGIKSITPPVRLSFTPYVSATAERFPSGASGSDRTEYKEEVKFSGGMDLKYGISDAFTLDMTLVPDFSQVQSDNQVLNLSPFEIQYNENRPFFLEGTELFNKGGFFYSRRVGGFPVNFGKADDDLPEHVIVAENPIETKMINGTKISGRTKSGLGVGVFNAVIGRAYATLRDTLTGAEFEREVQPLTNYNVAVLDQTLKNNSYVTLVNTNVMRQGSTYDANLTAFLFRLNTKDNKYAVDGRAALSQQYFTNDTKLGYTYSVGAGKTSGKFTYNFNHSVESDTYNPNDLGILFSNNSMEETVNFNYNIYQPFWKFLNMYTNIGAIYARRYKPDTFQNFVIFSNLNATLKNFTAVGLYANLEPVKTYDFFEARAAGWYYEYPVNYSVGGYVSTNYSKKFALDVSMDYRKFDDRGNRNNFSYQVSPRFRAGTKLLLVYRFNNGYRHNDIGFAKNLRGEKNKFTLQEIKGDSIVFGLRAVDEISNSLQVEYTFNNRMSLSLVARHNWYKVNYRDYFILNKDGKIAETDYNPAHYNANHDLNANYFNLDMVYSWWFAPGSELAIVWKDAFREEVHTLKSRYFDNVNHTFSSPQSNMLSVKVLYYIDYLTLKNKFGKGRL
ncbi:carbohydrate binding family 9 domain-containing protein [Pontibacter sp. BT310]|uniref:Carbohydrate binding family 9 domain-containing protein n=1 Tax=Pontibacter populi TaxID=890055 RepID=A0ABS6X8I9_9BACT|nr:MULTISPECIES: DUF5916 domain-containing protein [Pontibacter]MBJ6117444.1 carbohydrate binding family 9 domain-containing protein [Pontibacter sp. BT310]MBR0569869.1 carbohydrate binding family 9 domain-containing protein [Microvirga sp. STS03]MBW3364297.1 carbohydrate binding family 9 domain-containing protein [Pontibacter populi]